MLYYKYVLVLKQFLYRSGYMKAIPLFNQYELEEQDFENEMVDICY